MSGGTASSTVSFANKGSVYNVNLKYVRDASEAGLRHNDSVLVVGQAKHLRALNLENLKTVTSQLQVPAEWLSESINYVSAEKPTSTESAAPANQGSATDNLAWLNKLVVYKVSDKASRHNTPSRAHAFADVARRHCFGENQLIVVACERKSSVAIAAAIARAYPLFNGRSDEKLKRNVFVKFHFSDSQDVETDEELNGWNVLGESVRLAAKIVDTPCAEMHTDEFLEEIKRVGKELNIEPVVIDGEDLNKRGFGGIYGVGKAATHTPKLVILSHLKPEASRTIAWVGKGIVYDTGGLSLKSSANMCTMKTDCGGAAGILGAFRAAVKLGFNDNLHAVFCLAENAIGPLAQRPDDIVTMYSGKTVEINNTDAEGRLVLGDGVAYAKKDLKANIILDMATLTGAQGIATGRYHAGLVTNNEEWENRTRELGKSCGDLVFPLVFAPELHFSEFDSEFADMTNSVARPNNASSSCAGLFIHSHLGSDFDGAWIHLDIAYPSTDKSKATGYGVSLLNTMFGDSSDNALFKDLRSKTD